MKKNPSIIFFMVITTVFVGTAAVMTIPAASGQQRGRGVQWAYGHLVLTNGGGVFHTADGSYESNGSSISYKANGHARTRNPGNPTMGVLDLLGADGWEAYSAVSTQEGIMVLMRRQY